MPLISVIIPAFNSAETIESTLESVFQQTLQDFEIIVINDGSTDATLNLLNTIQDPRLTVLTYENSGVSTSRNRGIAQAQGDFIAFLDADDIWLPNKLMTQLQALQENAFADVAYSWTDYIDTAGNFLYSGLHPRFSGNVHRQLLLGCFLETGSNPLIRRQALVNSGNFDPLLSHSEDWELWLRLAKNCEFTVVPSVQVLYRVSIESCSFNLSKYEESALAVIEKHATLDRYDGSFKKYCVARIYKGLIFKIINTAKTKKQPHKLYFLRAINHLLNYIKYHPSSLWKEPKVLCSAFLRALLLCILTLDQLNHLLKIAKTQPPLTAKTTNQ
jgi:glycosyltransferase involved in cell wall biosynthesis